MFATKLNSSSRIKLSYNREILFGKKLFQLNKTFSRFIFSLYTFGDNSASQCGQFFKGNITVPEIVPQTPKSDSVIDIALGWKHSIILTGILIKFNKKWFYLCLNQAFTNILIIL